MILHIPNGDDWSEAELEAGEKHAANVKAALVVALDEIDVMRSGSLSPDKRAVVELTVLLELAGVVARERLSIGGDDFAISALEVFTASER